MPDFDIDFDERRRGEVIRYVTEKYGEDRVAMIVTYGTIKAKQAVKDSSRILGYPFAMGDRVTKAMPAAVMGKDVPLKEIFNPEHKRYGEAGEFRGLYDNDADVKRVVDTALGIEGLKRQWGVHAAGVIMSSEPLADVIPLLKRPADGVMITQFDYPTCESLGLIKMDFLGLRNLTVLDDCVHNIEVNRGEKLVLEDLPLDDVESYQLLGTGNTLGVFQLDGGPMRSLLRLMRPDSFEDISAVLALYRPGPMGVDSHTNYALRKNGKQEINPVHRELAEPLAEILEPTYGLIVYQEQILAVAQKVAGYTLGQADLLRKAMGKKKKEILDAEYGPFSEGMRANGYSAAAIKALWDTLVPFSDYAFNKAHTASYGLISYWTAYLKQHYAPEYMAALLTSVRDDKDKSAIYLNECRRMKIQVLPPDVNESVGQLHPGRQRHPVRPHRDPQRRPQRRRRHRRRPRREGPLPRLQRLPREGARAGLQQARGRVADQGRRVRRHEAPAAGAGGDPRAGRRPVRRRQAQRGDRPGLAVRRHRRHRAASASPSRSPTTSRSGTRPRLLGHERDMLGLYVSDHPLLGLEHVLSQGTDCTIGQLMLDEERPHGSTLTVSGLVTSVQRKITKRGDSWATITLEDLDGAIEVLLFPSTYQLASTLLVEDSILRIKGALSRDKDQPELRAQEVTVPDLSGGPSGPVVISLPSTRCTPPTVAQLRDVLGTHPGVTEVRLRLLSREKTTVMRLDDRLRVTPSPALFADLKQLLGPGCLTG